jgi:hypothetical protein
MKITIEYTANEKNELRDSLIDLLEKLDNKKSNYKKHNNNDLYDYFIKNINYFKSIKQMTPTEFAKKISNDLNKDYKTNSLTDVYRNLKAAFNDNGYNTETKILKREGKTKRIIFFN